MDKPDGYRKGDVLYRASFCNGSSKVWNLETWVVVEELPVKIRIRKRLPNGDFIEKTKDVDPYANRKFAYSQEIDAVKSLWWRCLRSKQHALYRAACMTERFANIFADCRDEYGMQDSDFPLWAERELEKTVYTSAEVAYVERGW